MIIKLKIFLIRWYQIYVKNGLFTPVLLREVYMIKHLIRNQSNYYKTTHLALIICFHRIEQMGKKKY